jgi:hypothetical protein
MKNIIRLLPVGLLPFCMATNLQAEVLAYEGFDSSVYTTTGGFASDNLSGQGTGSGSGFTSDWGAPTTDGETLGDYWMNSDGSSEDAYFSASTGQASYTDANSQSLSTTSGQATFTGDGTEVSLQRFTTTGVSFSDSLYISALVTLDSSSAGILFGAAAVTTGSSSDRPFQFGFTSDGYLTATGYSTSGTVTSTSSSTTGTGTYLLVAKITSGDNLELWLNPLLGDESGSGTADLTISGASFYVTGTTWSIDGLTIDATGEGSVTIDEIRIGTTWEDVTTSVIPEPSTLFIPALTLFSLGMIRRRKRA